MSAASLAKRYAKALVDVIFPKGEMQIVVGELNFFQTTMKSTPELAEVISNPTIVQIQKENLLTELTSRMKLNQTTINFLKLLLHNQRLINLDLICEALVSEVDNRLGRISAEVTTTHGLSLPDQDKLEDQLRKMTGKNIKVVFYTNPELLGGVVTKIGSKVYDGSIRSQLESFKAKLSQE